MIEKIRKWKIVLDDFPIVLLNNEAGLVKTVLAGDRKEFDSLKGWNMYSVVRSLFISHNVIEFYRESNGQWIKMNTNKIKEIAEQPFNTINNALRGISQ